MYILFVYNLSIYILQLYEKHYGLPQECGEMEGWVGMGCELLVMSFELGG